MIRIIALFSSRFNPSISLFFFSVYKFDCYTLESIWTWFSSSIFFFFSLTSNEAGSFVIRLKVLILKAVYGLLNRFGIQIQSLYSYVFQFSNLIITCVRILIGQYLWQCIASWITVHTEISHKSIYYAWNT